MGIELRASVRRGPRPGIVVVYPGGGASLRLLERALQDVAVNAVAQRASKGLYMPISDFARARAALVQWKVEVEPAVQIELDRESRGLQAVLRARRAVEDVSGIGASLAVLKDFPEAPLLDPHQLEAVAVATHPDVRGMCLFDEQGLGKTVTALFSFHRLRQMGEVTRMLVVAPKSMVLEWVHDAERFFRAQYRVQAVVGTQREKRHSLNAQADIYVTNFETTVGLQARLRELLEVERGRALLVVDESFFVKSSGARRTQAVRGLRASVDRCLVLCGTPAPNSPHDLVQQFNIADGGTAFRGVTLPEDREEARPVVQKVIQDRGVYLRRLKQDVLPELPGKTFHQILVRLQPEQGRIYAVAVSRLIRDLRSTDDVTFRKRIGTFLAQRMALLQICSHPASIVSDYREIPAKLLALDSILEELVSRRGEKVVVWSFFTASVDSIYRRYERFNPVRFDGKVPLVADRRSAVKRFQNDDQTMLFVGNPAAAGAGVTLHRARFAVYESMSNQAAHYLQSLDRIHRRGQDRPVEYVILLCDRTVEVQEYARLSRKELAAQVLLGDEVEPPITRQTMLDDAENAAAILGMETPLDDRSVASARGRG